MVDLTLFYKHNGRLEKIRSFYECLHEFQILYCGVMVKYHFPETRYITSLG